MGGATIRRVLGMHTACTRHVYAERLPKGCGSNAETFPKHPEAMRKMQTIPDWPEGLPKASQRISFPKLPKQCRRVPSRPEGFPKDCGAPRSRPESNIRCPNFKTFKRFMPKIFLSRVGPDETPKASRKDAEGFPDHPECMPKLLNLESLPSGTLGESFGVRVESSPKGFELPRKVKITIKYR